MTQNTIQILFALVRSAVCGNKLTEQERGLYNEEMLPDLIKISKMHDIAHLVAVGLDVNELMADENKEIGNEIITSVYRYTQLNYEYLRLCKALETTHISFIPLKGSVLRKYYPEPWMRTSCDIDILVRYDEVDKAVAYLVDNCGYTNEGKTSYDISLFSPNNIHIELHYDLVEEGQENNTCSILNTVWDNVSLKEGYQHWYEMSDEMFYFYHIAHMAKHFEQGGCGIRPFIDLWILDGIESADKQKRNELLLTGGLLKFTEVARHLSKVWLGNAEHNDITKRMEQYILCGGVYGTNENCIVIQQQRQGGRFMYALSKIFIPYDVIKYHYPILQKHRWLTPIMEIRRWFKLVFCGHAKRSMRELKYNQSLSDIDAADTREFLNNIGL